MASMQNAFDLLNQAQSLQQGQGKKKKKAQKQGAGGAENGAAANGTHEVQSGAVVEVLEAVEAIERSAHEARSVADKCKLWKDWSSQVCRLEGKAQQAGERGPRAAKYRDADGSTLNFQQVLLRSRAFESSLEAGFAQGLNDSRLDVVAQLLLTCSRLSAAQAQSLAQSLVHLSALIQNESLDVKGAAQHAVHSIAVALKAGRDSEGPGGRADQMHRLSHAVVKEQNVLNKLLSSSTAAASKEQAEVANKIFHLTGEQFELLQSDNLPNTAVALEQLRNTISSKVKVPEPKGGKGGKAAAQAEAAASKASLLASLRKEEADLASQAEQLATQIRSLEVQLRSLQAQQRQVEDKKAAVQQRMRMAGDPLQSGKGGGNAAQSQQQLEVVNTLAHLVLSSTSNDADAQAALPVVSTDYVAAAKQFLSAAKTSMLEMPNRMSFYKQRITQAEGLQRLGAKNNTNMKEEAERLLAEVVRSADDLLKRSTQVVAEVAARHDTIVRSLTHAEPGTIDALRSMDVLLAEIRSAYDLVQQHVRPSPVATPPVAAAAPKATAPKASRPGPASQAPAPAQIVAVAAPAPARTAPTPPPAPQPAAVPVSAPVAAEPAPKSAFDAAAAYLANMSIRPTSARPAATTQSAAAQKPTAPPARPASAATTAPRQWSKPVDAAAAAQEGDEGGAPLPTPAEAFKAPAAAEVGSTSSGAEAEAPKTKKKGNRAPKA